MIDCIYLIRNKAAVDATILTKDKVIPEYAKSHGIALENIAAIGDEVTDIPMLEVAGLGIAGAPSNAQKRVIEAVRKLPNGWVSPEGVEVFNAFLEFYSLAGQKGISHVISDRDGVLVSKGDLSRGKEYLGLLQQMGAEGRPYVTALTGSAVSQNKEFMEKYGLVDPSLRSNPAIRENPYLVLAENGLIHINVLTGEALNFSKKLNPDLLKRLKQEFEPAVAMKIEAEVLDEFGLRWSGSYDDQDGKIYIPPKLGMVTFNIPRHVKGKDYRNSEESEKLRDRIISIMAETAENRDIPYKIL